MKKILFALVLPLALLLTCLFSGTLFAIVVQPLNDREIDVVWSTSDGQRMEIYYAHKKEGIWAEPVRVTDDYYENVFPVIDRDSTGKRWVFWTAYNNGSMELHYATGENDDWQESETLADEMKTNISPSVIIDKQDTVWVVWSANSGDLDDIYFAFNEKNSWSEPATLHARNSVPDMLPEIGLDGSGHPAVTWKTFKDGKTATVTSRLTDHEWTVPQIKEIVQADQESEETLELPSFVNNSSMVFVRVY